MDSLLELRDCTMQFGGLTALSKLSLQIGPRDLVGLIGPNGAGKTTVFNIITGIYEPTSGTIQFSGQSLVGRKASAIAARGVARTFQNIRLFASLTVYDNVRAAFTMHLKHGIAHALWRGGSFRKEEDEIRDQVLDILKIFRLEESAGRRVQEFVLRRSTPAGNRARPRHAAEAVAPGRAGCGNESAREGGAHGTDPVREREISDRGAARGA